MPTLIDGLFNLSNRIVKPVTTNPVKPKPKPVIQTNVPDTTPPAFQNNVYDQVAASLGALTSGGNTLQFSFGGNYTVTVTKTGTVVMGTGTANAIPQLSDANTIIDSNLRMTGSNVLTLAASGTATATIPYSGTVAMPKVIALTPGVSVSCDLNLATVFTLTPGEDETITPSGGNAGQTYTLVITTSGTTSRTLTFASPCKVTGTLATGTVSGKVFVMQFVWDGTNLAETARTTAM
jgi:hypothetical protein